ncbi:hypothetical protein NicSoilB4_15070 [Arthrobacter sp. NicSoilB4]|nr:hypothetical protein NicSoilB4_15070 [Arthrobacter sp. NicSoilB4]
MRNLFGEGHTAKVISHDDRWCPMALVSINAKPLRAINPHPLLPPIETSTTVAMPDDTNWAYVEVNLAQIDGSGTAQAWIWKTCRNQGSDQILCGLSEDPFQDGASGRWVSGLRSATFCLRVDGKMRAYANCKLTTWKAP